MMNAPVHCLLIALQHTSQWRPMLDPNFTQAFHAVAILIHCWRAIVVLGGKEAAASW